MVSPRRQFRDRSSTIAGHVVSGTWDPGVAGICTLVDAAYRREAGRVPKPVDVLNIMEVAGEGGTDDELASRTEPNIPGLLGGVEPDPEVGGGAGEPARESGLEHEGPVRDAPSRRWSGAGVDLPVDGPGSAGLRDEPGEAQVPLVGEMAEYLAVGEVRTIQCGPQALPEGVTPAPERPVTVMRRLLSRRRSTVASGGIGHDPAART